MEKALVQAVLEAGTGVVAILVIAWMFVKVMTAHREERSEWRQSDEKSDERVAEAMDKLSRAIDRLSND